VVRVPLTENQYSAVVSLVYNIGGTNFRTSTLLRKLNKGDYDGAANEFRRWVYAKHMVLGGLVARRERERELFLTPDGFN
jgi:lysozyme